MTGLAAGRPSALRLLLPRRPADIAGLVIPVVVDAVEREPHRPQAHIGQEVLKADIGPAPPSRDVPPTAHADTPSTVVLVLLMARVRASGQHRSPDGVLSGSGHAVRRECGGLHLAPVAAARHRSARYDVSLSGNNLGAAVASEGPEVPTGAGTVISIRSQSTKSCSGDVLCSRQATAALGVPADKMIPNHNRLLATVTDAFPPCPLKPIIRDSAQSNKLAKPFPDKIGYWHASILACRLGLSSEFRA